MLDAELVVCCTWDLQVKVRASRQNSNAEVNEKPEYKKNQPQLFIYSESKMRSGFDEPLCVLLCKSVSSKARLL